MRREELIEQFAFSLASRTGRDVSQPIERGVLVSQAIQLADCLISSGNEPPTNDERDAKLRSAAIANEALREQVKELKAVCRDHRMVRDSQRTRLDDLTNQSLADRQIAREKEAALTKTIDDSANDRLNAALDTRRTKDETQIRSLTADLNESHELNREAIDTVENLQRIVGVEQARSQKLLDEIERLRKLLGETVAHRDKYSAALDLANRKADGAFNRVAGLMGERDALQTRLTKAHEAHERTLNTLASERGRWAAEIKCAQLAETIKEPLTDDARAYVYSAIRDGSVVVPREVKERPHTSAMTAPAVPACDIVLPIL